MSALERFYTESRFGGFSDIDGTIAFFNRINALLKPSFVVLDVGCGRGAYGDDPIAIRRDLRILKGKVAKVIGVDVDPTASKNPFLDEFYAIQDYDWPIGNDSVDMVVCDYVLEHVGDPEKFFHEIVRVLKNGGLLALRTPNRWNYVALAATLIPNRYHSRVTSFVQSGRKEEDVFPTVYRCNSLRKLRRTMRRSGVGNCVVYGYESEPGYLAFSILAYFFGVIHQKLAPQFLKSTLFAFGQVDKSSA